MDSGSNIRRLSEKAKHACEILRAEAGEDARAPKNRSIVFAILKEMLKLACLKCFTALPDGLARERSVFNATFAERKATLTKSKVRNSFAANALPGSLVLRSQPTVLVQHFRCGDQADELLVRWEASKLFGQLLHRFDRVHGVERSPKRMDSVQRFFIMQ